VFFYGSVDLVGLGLLIVEVPRSNSNTPHSKLFLWASDRSVAEICTWKLKTLTRGRQPCQRRDSNPPVPESEPPYIHTLGRAASGICFTDANLKIR